MPKTKIDRVLVAVDGSAESMEAARYALELVRGVNPKVTVLHVVPNPTIPVGAFPVSISTLGADAKVLVEKAIWDGAQAILGKAMKLFQEAGVEVEGVTTANDDAAVEIVELARKGRYDLVVVARGGEGEVEKAILGSTSEAVVLRSPCPVLVARRGTRAR